MPAASVAPNSEDGADRDAGLAIGALGDFLGLVAVAGRGHVQHAGDDLAVGLVAGRVDVAQPDQIAVFVGRRLDRAARIELVDAAGAGVVGEEGLQFRRVQFQALQHRGQRVARADAGFADVGRGARRADFDLFGGQGQDALDDAGGGDVGAIRMLHHAQRGSAGEQADRGDQQRAADNPGARLGLDGRERRCGFALEAVRNVVEATIHRENPLR